MADFEPFWNAVCEYQHLLRGLVALLVVMTSLLAFSFPFLEPGTGSYAIAVVDLGLLLVAFALVGSVSLGCARRDGD